MELTKELFGIHRSIRQSVFHHLQHAMPEDRLPGVPYFVLDCLLKLLLLGFAIDLVQAEDLEYESDRIKGGLVDAFLQYLWLPFAVTVAFIFGRHLYFIARCIVENHFTECKAGGGNEDKIKKKLAILNYWLVWGSGWCLLV
jgi:hypothetical protein